MRAGSGLCALLLAGCTTMSEVQPIGQGRYMVGTSVRGGFTSDTEVKAGALTRARAFCAGQGKEMVLLNSVSSGTQGWTPQNAEVTFKCE
jgi:hypothetical protein